MKGEFSKCLSILLALSLVFSTCLCAIGTAAAGIEAIYYVGTTTSDAPDGSEGNPYATVTDAISAANTAAALGEGDTLNVVALNDVSWGVTATPAHNYDVVVKSNTTAVALSLTSMTNLGGTTTFDNINASVASASGGFCLYRKDFTLTKTASLVAPYFIAGRSGTSGDAEPGQTIIIDGSLNASKQFTLGNDWNNVVYSGDLNVTINDPAHSFKIYFGSGNGMATYANVKINIKAAAGVSFASHKNGDALRYDFTNGTLQVINSTATAIGLDDGGLADIDDSKKWIINNANTSYKNALDFTATPGKIKVNPNYNATATNADGSVTVGTTAFEQTNIIDLTTANTGAGVYTANVEKLPATYDYYVQNGGTGDGTAEGTPAATVADAVTTAIANDVAAGDTLRVNVLGTTAVQWGTVSDHSFKLLLTSDVANAGVTAVDRLGGETVVEKITFDTVNTLHTNGHKFVLAETAKYTCTAAVSAWMSVGDTNHATYNDINMEFNATTGPRYLHLGTDAKYCIYNGDINLVFNNASYNPNLKLGSNWTASTAINANLNIYIKNAASFTLGDNNPSRGYAVDADAAMNVINTDEDLTVSASNITSTVFPASQIWIINDKSGIDGLIKLTDQKGKFEVAVPMGYTVTLTKSDSSATTLGSGIATLDAGVYTITTQRKPATFDYYVQNGGTGDGKTSGTPAATVGDAVTNAIANDLTALDTLRVNVLGTTAVEWGTVPTHEFPLIITTDVSGAAVDNISGLSGDTTFEKVELKNTTYTSDLYTNGYDLVVESNVTHSLTSKFEFTNASDNSPTYYHDMNIAYKLPKALQLNFGSYWKGAAYNGDINLTIDNASADPVINMGSAKNANASFNSNVNFIVKNAGGFTLKTATNCLFGADASVQVINSSNIVFSDVSNGLDLITNNTSGIAVPKWILNNDTEYDISVTETAGIYSVPTDVILHAYKGGQKVAESEEGVLDLTQSGDGVYSIVEFNPPRELNYTIANGEKTVCQVIEQAISEGLTDRDTAVITLTGDTAVKYGYTTQTHLFKVVIKSCEDTPVDFAPETNVNLVGIVGNTVFDGVVVKRSDTSSGFILFNGYDIEMTADTTISGITWLLSGNNTATTSYDEQNLIFNNVIDSGKNISLSSEWKGLTYSGNVNITVGNSASAPKFAFGTNRESIFNGNINIKLNGAGITSIQNNASSTFGGAINIISKNALNDTVYTAFNALTVAGVVYTVYDKTGEDTAIDFGDGAGKFIVPSEKTYRAVRITDKAYADFSGGNLNLASIGAGNYFISIPEVYSGEQTEYAEYINYRDSLNGQKALNNLAAKLNNKEDVNVVYYGGSVTAGAGVSDAEATSWRARIGTWLEVNFPQSDVTNINSAIGGTSTYLGSYRLNHAVIEQQPDLLFIEFSINDYYDRSSDAKTSMQLETIIRQVREELPECDIVTVLVTDRDNAANAQNGELHSQAKVHEAVSAAYGIPTIQVGRALADKLPSGFTDDDWKVYFPVKANGTLDIVHPNENGYAVYADVISEFLANSLLGNTAADTVVNHTVPEIINDKLLNGNIQLYKMNDTVSQYSQANGGSAFDFQSGGIYPHFEGKFHLDETSDVLVMQFEGTELALLDHHTSCFALNVQIDDGEVNQVTLSDILPTILASGLTSGTHKAKIWPAFTDGQGEWTNIYGLFGRDENLATTKGSEEYNYYVQSGGTGDGSSEATPAGSIADAVAGAIANGIKAKDTLTVTVLGTVAVEWGELPNHAFDLTVTAKTQGTQVSGVDRLFGNTTFDNVTVASDNNVTLYTYGYNLILNKNVTYARTSKYINILNGYANSTYENDINIYYGVAPTNNSIIHFGDTWKWGAYSGDINITVDNASANPKFIFGSANGTSAAFNKNININYKNAAAFTLGIEGYCNFGPYAAVQIINSTFDTLAENTGELAKITNNTSGNPVPKWILNNKTEVEGFNIEFTDVAGTYEVTVPEGVKVQVKKPDGSTALVNSGELVLASGVSTFTAIKEAIVRDYYVSSTAGATPDGSEGNPYLTVADAINAAASAGSSDGDIVNVYIVGSTAVNWGTVSADYAFKLNVATAKDSAKATINMSNSNDGALKGDTAFSNVVINVNSGGEIYFYGHDISFDVDTDLLANYISFNKYSGATDLGGQTVRFDNSNTYKEVKSSNNATSYLTYAEDVNIYFNNSKATYKYYLSSNSNTTVYNANLNLNFARAAAIQIKEAVSTGTATLNGALQVIVPANVSFDNAYILSEAATAAKGYWYITDNCLERGLLDFTATAGVYTVSKDVTVYASHSDGVTTAKSLDGKLDLSKKSGQWTITTKEYFEDFDQMTASKFANDWAYRTTSEYFSFEDGAIAVNSMDSIHNKSAIIRNTVINSKNQYISVDVKGENFGYTYGGAGLYARVDAQNFTNAKPCYSFTVTGGKIRLRKFLGYAANGYTPVINSDDFDISNIYGKVPYMSDFSYNDEHTYRLALSVVDDPNSDTVAYVTAIVLNLTNNTVVYHETFKDTARIDATGFGFTTDGSDLGGEYYCTSHYDNLYFSTEGFREGDMGDVDGDINYDGIYDIRDLVYADDYIGGKVLEQAINLKATDKDHNDLIDGDDIAIIRKELLKDSSEFYYVGDSDTEAAALRESIVKSADTNYSISGTKYYVSSFAENGNGTKESPWSLQQLNESENDSKIKSGDAVLFERGSVFSLVQPYAETSLSSARFQYYAYVSAKGGVTYGAYTGNHGDAKPLFRDSARNYAEVTWTETSEGSNIWVYEDIYSDLYLGERAADNGAANIIFNGGKEIGNRRSFTGIYDGSGNVSELYTLFSNGHFTTDTEKGLLYLYCDKGNPAEVYNSIEVVRGDGGILIKNMADNVTVDNLEFSGFGHAAIMGLNGNDNITITNCVSGFAGGMVRRDSEIANDFARLGGALGVWNGGASLIVDGNWVYQTYDTAISPQGDCNANYDNFTVTNNLFEYNNADVEFFDNGEAQTTSMDNWKISDNIMRFTGLGWGSREVDGLRGIEGVIRGSTKGASKVNIEFKNNIIDTPAVEIFSLVNTTAYTDAVTDGSGNVTTPATVDGIFLFGKGYGLGGDTPLEIGNNKYFFNPFIRNSKRVTRGYMVYDTDGETILTESGTRHYNDAQSFVNAIKAIDTSNTSQYYWSGNLIG